MIGLGTLINVAAIVVGGGIGLAGGKRLSSRAQQTLIRGMAVCVLFVAIGGVMEEMLVVENGALRTRGTLMLVVSIALGGLMGELLDLDRRMRTLGDWVQTKTERLVKGDSGAPSISEGFVTASLLFCVGAMAIVGALQDGLTGDHSTLFAKSLLDGISSIVFGASLGLGVSFSAVAVLIYQGLIALLASFLAPLLGDAVIAEMTCVGSLLIVALSLNMLGLTKIKVMNLVPAILLPIVLCLFI